MGPCLQDFADMRTQQMGGKRYSVFTRQRNTFFLTSKNRAKQKAAAAKGKPLKGSDAYFLQWLGVTGSTAKVQHSAVKVRYADDLVSWCWWDRPLC